MAHAEPALFQQDMSKELFWHLGLHKDMLSIRGIELQNASIFGPEPAASIDSSASSALVNNAARAGCFPLRKSRYCGGSSYGGYQMSALVAVDGQHVDSAAAFDRVLDAYFGSADEFRYINRNQSLRGRPDRLVIRQHLEGSLSKQETGALNGSSSCIQDSVPSLFSDTFTVLYPYSPVESDELRIESGDQVRLLRLFSDGWIFVQRVDDGCIGAVPAVCLDTDPSELVDYSNNK
ncbi:hypothetical protein GGF39_003529 [Coemansia sp. RSA 1721]|nr:hypothetical protein GGF39_003529 [Coemansia sp. RSA 1721]